MARSSDAGKLTPSGRLGGRTLATVAIALAILLFGAAGGWAFRTAISPPEEASLDAGFGYVVASQGSVGEKRVLRASASWPVAAEIVNVATGTVTSLAGAARGHLNSGDTLFEVNLRPIVIASGTTPAFRELGPTTKGADVKQLQEMLITLGFLNSADGSYGSPTERAVRSWQKSLGVEQSGRVGLGDILFSPALPAQVQLDSKAFAVGIALVGGERIQLLAGSPSIDILATSDQAAEIPAGVSAAIDTPDGSGAWSAVTGEQRADEADTVRVALSAQGEASICGDQCSQIPLAGEIVLTVTLDIVPAVEGLTVPSTAVKTDNSGETQVVDDEGVPHKVSVVASAQGLSIIEGVPEGTRLRIPADER